MPFNNLWLAFGITCVCIVCLIITLMALYTVKPKIEIIIRESKHIPAELMSYIFLYVVTLMSIDYQDIGKFVGLTIFLIWMFWITHKSGRIILNPLLTAFGWRLYDVSYHFVGDTHLHTASVLSNAVISVGERHRQTSIQDVLIIKSMQGAGS
jgi:hypothetical protein